MNNGFNVFLLTDIEGIAGIDAMQEIDRESNQYDIATKKLCASINLAVAACFDEGANRVYYLDGHAGGGNVDERLIDQRAVKCTLSEWQELLKEGMIDCQIEIGAHARAGTVGGFLDHTLSSKSIFAIKVNGCEMSEFSLHAILCAKYGVPIIALTGDETACAQAKEYVPDIYTGAVKIADCRNAATTYPDADKILYDTVRASLANRHSVSLIPFEEPICVEQTFYRTDMCEEALEKHADNVLRIDARTLKKTVSSISSYADLKI